MTQLAQVILGRFGSSNGPARAATFPRRLRRCALFAMVSLPLALCGCSDTARLDTQYGEQSGIHGGPSINGTAVFSKMWEDAGFEVVSRRAITPAVRHFDTIVWFPDDLAPPTEEVRKRLEDWLKSGRERTLIYVGRDYDAEPYYYRRMLSHVEPEQREDYSRRLKDAEARVSMNRRSEKADCPWFTFEPSTKTIHPAKLEGPWSEGVNAKETDITLTDELVVKAPDETLLGADNRVIAARIRRRNFGDGQIIVVQNGSFLLNMPLVNHEHRRLARTLISEVEPVEQPYYYYRQDTEAEEAAKRVLFLESGQGGPAIRDNEPQNRPPTLGDYPPPLSDILYHGVAVAVIAIFAGWPIFGRARRLPATSTADFGQHVDAVADLLRRTKDDDYCQGKIEEWFKRDAKPPPK